MPLSLFILFDYWGIFFCFNVSWRNQSIDLRCGSFVWILFGAWYLVYCNFYLSFISLFDRLFFVSTFFVLDLLFHFCSGVCSIINFQRCRLILCNIEGQSEFSTISNSSIDGNIKKCFNRHFLRRISWLDTVFYRAISWCHFLCYWLHYCFLPCDIVVSLFMLLTALIYIKPKVHNVATISAFALFFVTCIYVWTIN